MQQGTRTNPKGRDSKMAIVRTPSVEALRVKFCPNDDEPMYRLDPIPAPVQERLDEITERFPNVVITLGRDWEKCIFGLVEGTENALEILAFTDDGRVGYGGVNLPIYHDTIPDYLDTIADYLDASDASNASD